MLINRNEDSLRLLQKSYGNMVHYIVRNILQNQQDVEECIGDIYLKIWNGADSYDSSKGKLATWLTAIARNTAINYRKRRQMPVEELNEAIGFTTSPEEELLRIEILPRESCNNIPVMDCIHIDCK